jgi:hypothetical protein
MRVTDGVTIESGGLVVTDGLTIASGQMVVTTGGVSIYGSGLTVTSGITVYAGGLTVTDGVTVRVLFLFCSFDEYSASLFNSLRPNCYPINWTFNYEVVD